MLAHLRFGVTSMLRKSKSRFRTAFKVERGTQLRLCGRGAILCKNKKL